jgi:RNA polymerase sigma factor (sigma-70 family)
MDEDEAWALVLQVEPRLRGAWAEVRGEIPRCEDDDDIIASAREHLFHMVQDWDPKRGYRSAVSYAISLCRYAVLSVKNRAPLPTEKRHRRIILKLRRASQMFTEQEGRSPSDLEVIEAAYRFGINPLSGSHFTTGQVTLWRTTVDPWRPLHIDGPAMGGGHIRLYEVIPDEGPGPEDVVILHDQICLLESFLSRITEQEQLVLRSTDRSFKSVGAELGITGERVRQIMRSGYYKMYDMKHLADLAAEDLLAADAAERKSNPSR